ncbi:PduM family microcompartment protein [Levilactobacillus andaensis]|uniref:PduM family microcompartment protein n=1 Tax=Levilactobacillus andaensis TaxID=2799570 RepID=UPI0019457E03|nr:PduM family microcompartment protein [Levilactobacillus andaensis]
MDDLVQKVIKKLKERQTANTVLSLNELPSPQDKQVFVDYGSVILDNVSIQFIKDLYSLKTDNASVLWVLNGINYGVCFYLKVNAHVINFIPRAMVLDWPIKFIVGRNSLIVGSYHKIISRREVAALPDNAILIKTAGQALTDEGLEICDKKNIKIKIRTEENCIWLE